MNSTSLFFVLGILLSLICQGFFTMTEMAVVSYNKLRLYHRMTQKDQRARRLHALLQNPTILFGTILIGVNFFLILGSECARLFYFSIGWDPFWALLSQSILVIIFAELSPMFAGRKYPEQIARFGIYPIYYLSKVLYPIVWILDAICQLFRFLLRCPEKRGNYLTREDLQKGIGLKGKKAHAYEAEFHALIDNIFSLQKHKVRDLKRSLLDFSMVPITETVQGVRQQLSTKYTPFLPVYKGTRENIVGVLSTKQLIGYEDATPIQTLYAPPWFISEESTIFAAFSQFRQNKLQIAIVLDAQGIPSGIVTLEDLLTDIFQNTIPERPLSKTLVIDRAFPSEMAVQDVNKLLNIHIDAARGRTLESFMASALGHAPGDGESFRSGPYVLTCEHDRHMGARAIRITTVL